MPVEQIDRFLKNNGFKQSSLNASLCVMRKGRRCVMVIVYVDDLELTSDDEKCVSQTQNTNLKFEFEMTHLLMLYFS